MNNKSPFRHDQTESYRDLKVKTIIHSPDPLQRLEFLQKHGNLAESLLCSLEIAQEAMYQAKSDDNPEIVIKAGHLDLLFRSFADALTHMQEDLPIGVYNYIQSNINGFLELTLKQIHNHTRGELQ